MKIGPRRDEVSVPDAAFLLGVTRATVGLWCRRGLLAARRDGRHWFPKLHAVDAINRHRHRIAHLRLDVQAASRA